MLLLLLSTILSTEPALANRVCVTEKVEQMFNVTLSN
jgi:hypothetical protein